MAWHWAQTLDQQRKATLAALGRCCWRHHTSIQPQPQSGPRCGGRSSRQLLTLEERVRAFTRLWPEPERAAAAGWIGVTFAAGPGVLSNLCRATATTALQLATNRPATAKPTIRTFQRTTLQRCAILLQNRLLGFFATKSTPRPAGTNPAVRGGERG